MATNYPYISGSGPVVKVVQHLRRSFPPTLDADVLKKLGLAPRNESYLLNIVRFLGLIDAEGKKVEAAAKVFLIHEDVSFQKEFEPIVKKAYRELFQLHGDDAWKLSVNQLITFFRQSDGSSAVVGQRQAMTFRGVAAICGHGEMPAPKDSTARVSVAPARSDGTAKKEKKQVVVSAPVPALSPAVHQAAPIRDPQVGLTVRIEINLPADGSQEVYDNIFQSIRKNLIDGK
jgi:hypothetical protein